MEKIPEILLVDKPIGITSFDVIRVLRKKLGIKKIGHAGTLDPLASGLMVVGIGEGTKKLAEYLKLDKEYEAEILVGEKRTTGDMEGEVVESKKVKSLKLKDVQTTLDNMVGILKLPVSAYSAIKKDGVPMYKRARRAEKKGETIVDLPIREMRVHIAELISPNIIYDNEKAIVQVKFKVGSGTYIRSLAEEFGRRLNYPATLKNLRRTKVGEFDIENAEEL